MDVDTIVAQATPPGTGAVAIVRLSGPAAVSVLEAIAAGGSDLPEVRRATLAELVDPDDGSPIDRALVTRFEAPASYTGEDVVEISCHGGWLTPRLIVDACVRSGAREAEPGEFTRRAYLRGKIDLVQAEAVADLIEARSRALHGAAMGQLERGLSGRISALRERLVRVEALLAHHVDFPEEDDAPVPLEDVAAEAASLTGEMEAMLATAPEGELLREGALAVFAGRPNVGKSSLYNALIGEERAIVTAEAGTTRDALEAPVQLGGFPFRLVDTAGLRESGEQVERLGIEVARTYVERADVVLFCVEAGRELSEEERRFLVDRNAPVVLVETKTDLVELKADLVETRADATETEDTTETEGGPVEVEADPVQVEADPVQAEADPVQAEADPVQAEADPVQAEADPVQAEVVEGDSVQVEADRVQAEADPVQAEVDPGDGGSVDEGGGEVDLAGHLRVSVETGQGLDQLRHLLPELVYSAVVAAGSENPVLTRRRHARALETARSEVEAFRAGLESGLPAEVAATHLRSAETALEELLGVVSVDDVLDVVFREFCIGK